MCENTVHFFHLVFKKISLNNNIEKNNLYIKRKKQLYFVVFKLCQRKVKGKDFDLK